MKSVQPLFRALLEFDGCLLVVKREHEALVALPVARRFRGRRQNELRDLAKALCLLLLHGSPRHRSPCADATLSPRRGKIYPARTRSRWAAALPPRRDIRSSRRAQLSPDVVRVPLRPALQELG